jgi:hypothetical protein
MCLRTRQFFQHTYLTQKIASTKPLKNSSVIKQLMYKTFENLTSAPHYFGFESQQVL